MSINFKFPVVFLYSIAFVYFCIVCVADPNTPFAKVCK